MTTPRVIAALMLSASIVTQAPGQCEATEHVKLVPIENTENIKFGSTIAISGNFVIGGHYHEAGSYGEYAPVFRLVGHRWIQETTLRASDGQPNDAFSAAVTIDGALVLVGAPRDDEVTLQGEIDDSGSAYVFRRVGGKWVEQSKLTAGDAAPHDHFGDAVALCGDVAVVTAGGDDDIGSAYVFRFDGEAWTEEAKLVPSDGQPIDAFGNAAAIDGDVVVIGARWADEGALHSGAVYIYRFDGSVWNEEKKLVPADVAANDWFGSSVTIDGDMVVAGSPHDDDGGSSSGSAYVFRFDGREWVEEAKLTAMRSNAEDEFGSAVTIEGNVIVVGAHEFTVGPGSAYVFRYDGAAWLQEASLASSEPLGIYGVFGWRTALSGSLLVTSSHAADGNAGALYVFTGISDCNGNGQLDLCDIATGASPDADDDGVADECPCPTDVTGEGQVDGQDLEEVMIGWGACEECPADLTGNGVVDVEDLIEVILGWGSCFPIGGEI